MYRDRPGRRPEITQARLEAYLAHQHRIRQLRASHRQMRIELLGLLDAGAAVESGPIGIRVSESKQRRLSLRTLKELLGEVKVAVLQQQVPVTVVRTVRVGPTRRTGAAGWGDAP